jgi:hypothetical protein
MENRFFLGALVVLTAALSLFGWAFAGDILLQEGFGEGAGIYKVTSEGSGLKKIGQGIFPEWSGDRRQISYIGFNPADMMKIIVVDKEGREAFRIGETQNKGFILRHSWEPKGEGVAFANAFGPEGSTVSYIDLKTRSVKVLHKFDLKSESEALLSTTLEWSPVGEKLLFSVGSLISKGEGVDLIDVKKGGSNKLSDAGFAPRFIKDGNVVFVSGSEVWTVRANGSSKKKLVDTGMPVLNMTNAGGGKVILSMKPKGGLGPFSFQLGLLNIGAGSLQEIKTEGYVFLSPEISPEGNQFAGFRLKVKDGLPMEQDPGAGFYVYDLQTKRMKLLKKTDPGQDKQFWMMLYLGARIIVWR